MHLSEKESFLIIDWPHVRLQWSAVLLTPSISFSTVAFDWLLKAANWLLSILFHDQV